MFKDTQILPAEVAQLCENESLPVVTAQLYFVSVVSRISDLLYASTYG